jgi:hypothetical protein
MVCAYQGCKSIKHMPSSFMHCLCCCAKILFCFLLMCRRRKDDGAEPEVDPERDQRTVFAFQVDF